MRNLLKYKIVITWSAADKAFIARAPELPGCMADGTSREEALMNIQVVMREWIETAKELGRPVPKPTNEAVPA